MIFKWLLRGWLGAKDASRLLSAITMIQIWCISHQVLNAPQFVLHVVSVPFLSSLSEILLDLE